MRLIGTFKTEKEAYALYAFLLKEEIQNLYEPFFNPESSQKEYRIWIYNEEDLERAIGFLNHFKERPEDPKFQAPDSIPAAQPPPKPYEEVAKEEELKWRTTPVRISQQRLKVTWTHLFLFLCIGLFLWNDYQEEAIIKKQGAMAVNFTFTPLQKALMFDYTPIYSCLEKIIDQYPLGEIKDVKEIPASTQAIIVQAESIPVWKGIFPFLVSVKKEGWQESKVPLFEKIRQGEFWRTFTPSLMHHDFLHILFNMAWLWILGKQIEDRIRWKMVVLILVVGAISNIAQYLMSGPNFLGFSGVVCGMAGFIWMRQRIASWEGYPLSRGTLVFLLLFVLSMAALQVVTFALHAFSVLEITPVIANTAHIVGGITGIALGRVPFFARGGS